MSTGFSTIELLVAMTITMLIAGAIAGVAPQARAAFDRAPADLDLQQRGRTAIDVLSQALRSAGTNVAATESLGALSDLLPTVSVSGEVEPGVFTELTVILPVRDAAQATLDADQAAAGGAMTLSTAHCPNINDVCGFTSGSTTVVADGSDLGVVNVRVHQARQEDAAAQVHDIVAGVGGPDVGERAA